MPTINIRWADNTEQLRARLKEGIGTIEAMKSAVDKTVRSLGGEGLLKAANNMTAAVTQLGGATKLTAAEQTRINDLLTKAIDKYRVLGQTAPKEMIELADATKQVEKSTFAASLGFESMSSAALSIAGSFGLAFSVGAVVSFGKAIAADADALVKMSDKTGISLQGLQKLQIAGDDAGNSIEDLTGSINQMQKRLAGDDKSAHAALTRLGLDFEEIRQMAPDRQFMAIGDAIRGVQDPAEQVALAMALFGRSGAEVLPTLKRGFDDLKDASVGMSDEAVKGWDKLGDAILAVGRSAKAATGELLFLIATSGKFAAAGPDFIPPPEAGGPQVNRLDPADLAALHAPLLKVNAAIKALGISEDEEATIVKDLNREYDDHHQKSLQAEADAKRQAAALKELIAAIEGTRQPFRTLSLSEAAAATGAAELMPSLKDVGSFSLRSATDLKGLTGSADDLARQGEFLSAAMLKVNTQIGVLPNVIPQATEDIKAATTATEEWTDVFAKFPSLITAALTGGGGLKGAIKGFANEISGSIFGEKGPLAGLTKGLTSGITKGTSFLGGTVSKLLGGIGGSLLPGIGGLIGPLMGKLIGHFQVSEMEVKGREAAASFRKGIGDALNSQQKAEAGGVAWKMEIIGVRDAYLATGRSAAQAEADVRRLHLAEKEGPEAVARVTAEIQKAFDEQKQDQQDVSDGVDNLVGAWGKAGQYIPASMRATLDSLLKMNGLTDAQRQKLQALSDSAKPNFESLTQTAKGYGIELAGLGPKFEQGDLEEKAGKLYDDFSALKDAGGDVGGILLGMSDEISGLVNESKHFGTSIPDNMKPLIQNLIDAGKLLDDNGKAITDIGGINFEATPLNKGLDDLNDTLKRLIDSLDRIDGKKITTTVNTNWTNTGTPPGQPNETQPATPPWQGPDWQGEGAYRGGLVSRLGVEHFAIGSRGPIGTDIIPAWLTPGEEVVSVADRRSIAGSLGDMAMALKGGAVAPTVIFNEAFTFNVSATSIDPRSSKEIVEKQLLPQIVEELEDRRRGYATRLQRVLASS